jgi:hypothetical protein
VCLENPLGHGNFLSGLKLGGERDGGLGLARSSAGCPLGDHMYAYRICKGGAELPLPLPGLPASRSAPPGAAVGQGVGWGPRGSLPDPARLGGPGGGLGKK